jgi:hypothetical protein
MFHLLPFAVGLLAGAAAVKLMREDKTKDGLEKVQDRLREATVNSLSAIEKSSARLRDRLAGAEDAAEAGETAAPPAVPAVPAAKEGDAQ